MKARGKIVNLDLDFLTHRPKLTIQLDNQYLIGYDEVKNIEDLDITIEKHKEKRSNDANAYCWLLCQEIANLINSTKEEVYRIAIRAKAPFTIVPIKDSVVDNYISRWAKNGLGWIAEVFGKSKIDGYTNVITYYGSSTFDKKRNELFFGLYR